MDIGGMEMAMYDRKQPYVIQEKPGKKAYCACGLTGNPPYCDGSHKGTGKQPFIVNIEEPKTVAICGCGKSGNLPSCDGTHTKL